MPSPFISSKRNPHQAVAVDAEHADLVGIRAQIDARFPLAPACATRDTVGPNNPHDALFRAVFSQLDNAAGVLRSVLPQDIASHVNWASLHLEDGHYVDEDLAARQSDLLYSASFGGEPILLYVLFEHQSSADRFMPFRFMRYGVRIWDRWLRDHDQAQTLPIILPVLLAHVDGGWRAAATMDELFALPEPLWHAVAPYVPRFRFVLDDLAARSDEELMARALQALGILGLLLLRHGRQKGDLVQRLAQWTTLFHAVWTAPDGQQALATLVRYAVLVNEATTIQDLARVLVPVLGPGAQEVIMTEGQRLIEQGRTQGRAEGEARGRAAGVLAVFSARGLSVSADQRERVLSCQDIATLDKWIQRAAIAASVDDALCDHD